ncbi:MAG: Omp28-related outer membrane protein [Chitinophagaceae bacterium]|nr:Omp28-related outer membrane protein [Chitinophagaceae bacterium]MCB9046395.1 Omp28-related outer membrane protein [Chitinophagales bacterium]
MRHLYFSALLLLSSATLFAQDTVSTNGQKNVLLESATGAWTGWAPDGIVFLDNVKASYPSTICLQHHNNDGMVNTQSTAYQAAFSVTGYPTGAINRKLYSGQSGISASRGIWMSSVAAELQNSPTFDVRLIYSYNPSTRVISANVQGTALTSLSGLYYTNVYIVEDSVTGTGSQYNQANYSDNTTGHPFFGKGNPITNFYHMNVVRDMLGGVYGTAAFNNPTTNTTANNSYTYTVPSGYDINHIRLVATISKYGTTINDREIQNAVETNSGVVACSYAQPQVQICVVTTDTVSGKNLIVWEKAGIQHAKSYKIYRETSTPGNYQLIGTQAANVFSTYLDAGSNPQSQSYTYKLTVVDSCNREMPLSSANAHSTVHVTFNTLSNNTIYISWVPYVGRPYTTYTISRSNNNGPWTQVAQVTSSTTSYNDANPPSGVNSYRVEIQVPGGCSPSAKTTAYNTIISNAAVAWHTGIAAVNGNSLKIYPNPANDMINVEGLNGEQNITILDVTGRVVLSSASVDTRNQVMTIDVSSFARGAYILKATDAEGNTTINRFQKL